jgi:hypothetical protein
MRHLAGAHMWAPETGRMRPVSGRRMRLPNGVTAYRLAQTRR